MLTRLRETARILSGLPEKSLGQQHLFDNYQFAYNHSEAAPEEENVGVVRLIDALLFVGIAMGVGHLIDAVQKDLSAGLVGAAVAAISVLSFKAIHPLVHDVVQQLGLGSRLSPYFGHKIAETRKILKS